jgi:hypothetical protein
MLNTSIPSCSEASRGLSVLSQGGGIFTDIAISPGPSLRQSPSCDAVRAGLNLPDTICYLSRPHVFTQLMRK